MPHELDLIFTLSASFAIALLFGYISTWLRLSPIIGYILAGFLVGPNTPGFTAHKGLADQLAEIGVILLMFSVGLEFHIKELWAVRKVAIPGAIVQIGFATLMGTLLGIAAGWGVSGGLIFGLALSVASTVVLIRVLADNNALHSTAGHIAVGWLVVEDLFVVFVLVLLPSLLGDEQTGTSQLGVSLGIATAKIVALFLFALLVGGRVIPWILEKVAKTQSRELFTLTVLVVALGIAVGAALTFQVSMALGAFLAGMIVGRSEFSLRAATEALPMRDAFAVLFFVSIGFLFDPKHLIESPAIILGALAIVFIGKPLAAAVITSMLRYPPRIAAALAIALAQIGEFSFILASSGRQLGLLGDTATNALITTAILSISLNPFLYRFVNPVARAWGKLFKGTFDSAHDNETSEPAGERHSRAILVGYGPVGETLARLLVESRIEPVILEMNLDTVRRVTGEGLIGIYGDALREESLVQAGVHKAIAIILTSADTTGVAEIVRIARAINPSIRVIARTGYLREAPALREIGADVVITSEGEVALAMTEAVLSSLGGSRDQIDRERSRIHNQFADRFSSGLPLTK